MSNSTNNAFPPAASNSLNEQQRVALLHCGVCKTICNPIRCRFFPCLHSVCSNCCDTCDEGISKKLTCTSCAPSQTWDVDADTKEHFLANVVFSKESKKCTNCLSNEQKKESIAKYICHQCGEPPPEYLCFACVNDHKRNKFTKSHILQKINKAVDDGLCPAHPSDELSWHCLSCDVVTCKTCQLENHKGHRSQCLQDLVKSCQNSINEKLKENTELVKNLKKVTDYMHQRVTQLTDDEVSLDAEIDMQMDKISQAVEQRREFLKEKVRQFTKKKSSSFLNIKTETENVESLTNQATNFGKAALSCADPFVLHRAAKCFENARDRIRKIRPDRRSRIVAVKNNAKCSIKFSTETIISNIQNFGDVTFLPHVSDPPKFMAASEEDLRAAESAQMDDFVGLAQQNITTAQHDARANSQSSSAAVVTFHRSARSVDLPDRHNVQQHDPCSRRSSCPLVVSNEQPNDDLREPFNQMPSSVQPIDPCLTKQPVTYGSQIQFSGHVPSGRNVAGVVREATINQLPQSVDNNQCISALPAASTVREQPSLVVSNNTGVVSNASQATVSYSAQPIQVDEIDSRTKATVQESVEPSVALPNADLAQNSTPETREQKSTTALRPNKMPPIPRYKRIYEENNGAVDLSSSDDSDTGGGDNIKDSVNIPSSMEDLFNRVSTAKKISDNKPCTEPFVPYIDEEYLKYDKYGKDPFDDLDHDGNVPVNIDIPLASLSKSDVQNFRTTNVGNLAEQSVIVKPVCNNKVVPNNNNDHHYSCINTPKITSNVQRSRISSVKESATSSSSAKKRKSSEPVKRQSSINNNNNNSNNKQVADSTSKEKKSQVERSLICEICRETGADLLLCSKCVKSFHPSHHVPPYVGERDTFVCGFCEKLQQNPEDYVPKKYRTIKRLTIYELKVCQRILLELYVHEKSIQFHEKTRDKNYLNLIKRPITFNSIREKLCNRSTVGNSPTKQTKECYDSVDDFVLDLNQVFINCDVYYEKESDEYNNGIYVGQFYSRLVHEYFPHQTVQLSCQRDDYLYDNYNTNKRRRVQKSSTSTESD